MYRNSFPFCKPVLTRMFIPAPSSSVCCPALPNPLPVVSGWCIFFRDMSPGDWCACYIVFLLHPHFQNYNKRLVKTPKLYFCDTGLAVWLRGIRESGQLTFHAQRGALFENLVVTEFLKTKFNRELSGREDKPAWLIYGGDRELQNGNVTIIPWRTLPKLAGQLGN